MISGNVTADGIPLVGRTDVTVRGCRIGSFDPGIRLSASVDT